MSMPVLSYKSKTTEVDSVLRLSNNAFKKDACAADPNLVNLFSDLEAILADLSDAILQLSAKSILVESDHVRDEDLRKLYTLVQGYTCHTDEIVISAAEKVFAVLDEKGLAVATESYDIETSEIVAILKELESLETEIGELPAVEERVTILKASNDVFMKEQLGFKEDKARLGEKVTATSLKKEALDHFNKKIIPYLNGMVIVNSSLYGEFVNTLAELINDNNSIVKKRASKK